MDGSTENVNCHGHIHSQYTSMSFSLILNLLNNRFLSVPRECVYVRTLTHTTAALYMLQLHVCIINRASVCVSRFLPFSFESHFLTNRRVYIYLLSTKIQNIWFFPKCVTYWIYPGIVLRSFLHTRITHMKSFVFVCVCACAHKSRSRASIKFIFSQ